MPGELLDLPPQGFALRGLLLDTPLQGFDLLGVPPLFRRCSVSYCADNFRKAAVSCRSNSVIQLLHSLDSITAGRPPTLQGGLSSEPAGITTNRSPSISRSVNPHVVSSSSARVSRACLMFTLSTATVLIRLSMLADNQCIVAQLPSEIPRKRLRPITRGRTQARISRTCIRPVDAAISSSMECCASLAAVLKLSPSLRSSRVAVASISIHSVSSFCRSLSVKSLWLEVMLVQRSLQPPPLPAVRIPRGHVAVALARHVKARLLQGGDDVGAALHGAVLDPLHEVVPYQLARLCLVLKAGPQCCRFDVGVGWHVCKVGNRFAALELIAQGLGRLYGSVEADVARGLALRMDHGSQYLSDHFLNQLRYWGIHPSFAFVEEPETNGVVERWNRTLKEQAVYGRVFRNLAEVRAAVAEFVERYNQCWRLEKLAYRTPLEAREQYELRHAA